MLKPKSEKVKLSKESVNNAKNIFKYLKPYSVTFAIGWVFLVLSTLTGLVFPLLMGKLLGKSTGESLGNNELFASLKLNDINQVAFALFILFTLQAIFSFFRVVTFTNVTENTLRDIREDSFSRLVYMPMDFFNSNKVGELTSRITSDISQLQEFLRTNIAEFFRQIVMVIGGIIFLCVISWKLSLVMIATVPVMAILAVIFGKFIKKLSKHAQDETAKANSVLEETLVGISNVKAFTNEIIAIGKFKKNSDTIRDINVKSGLWRGSFISFIFFCLFGSIVFIVWRGLLMTQGPNPELSQEGFYAFIMLTIMMGGSVGSLPELYANMQKAIGATDNLMKIIQLDGEKEVYTGKQTPNISGDVEFKDVRFSYPQRKDIEILKGISLKAKSNETIALVGSSGAGKSTIASLLLRYYDIDNGKLYFDGIDSKEIDINHLRKHIAFVPQEVILFSGSIYENIAYGRPNASKEEIIEAARQANALSFIESFPNGLETEVGDRGIQLSGGQKQRIAIARAILKNPTILILDEATSALDSESEKLVQEALEKLMQNRTSIVIAHRLSTIRNADNIFVMDKGIVVEIGKHEELIKIENGIYANLVEIQMK